MQGYLTYMYVCLLMSKLSEIGKHLQSRESDSVFRLESPFYPGINNDDHIVFSTCKLLSINIHVVHMYDPVISGGSKLH